MVSFSFAVNYLALLSVASSTRRCRLSLPPQRTARKQALRLARHNNNLLTSSHLNPIFRPRIPKPYFPVPGPSKQVGDVFKCIWGVFVASNLHVEMVKTVAQSLRSTNILGFLQFRGVLLPALRGEHIFEKRIQTKIWPYSFIFNALNVVLWRSIWKALNTKVLLNLVHQPDD